MGYSHQLGFCYIILKQSSHKYIMLLFLIVRFSSELNTLSQSQKAIYVAQIVLTSLGRIKLSIRDLHFFF